MIKINLRTFGSTPDPKPNTATQAQGEKGPDLDVIQKKIDEMLAKAQETATQIIEGAQSKAAEIVDEATEQMKAVAKENAPAPDQRAEDKAAFDAYMNEEVPVYLFKDNNKYRDDVPVTVNGETILIQRGKHVNIKRKFAQALEMSNMQDAFAADLMTDLADQYKSKESRLS